jgi:hypothetical protein
MKMHKRNQHPKIKVGDIVRLKSGRYCIVDEILSNSYKLLAYNIPAYNPSRRGDTFWTIYKSYIDIDYHQRLEGTIEQKKDFIMVLSALE